MIFPELLGGVLAGDALEDLGASGVVVDKVCGTRRRQLTLDGDGRGEWGILVMS